MSSRIFNLPAWRIARRELRGGLRGFGVFIACLFLGVLSISGIGSFTAAARSGLLVDAGALLGGDLELRLIHREITAEQRSWLEVRGQLSSVARMRTMAWSVANNERTLVELKAVDELYPLYGILESEPSLPLRTALAHGDDGFGALAEASLLQRLGLAVGDRLRVGEREFVLRGVILNEPDRRIRAFNLGPRLMISREGLAATGLLKPGSLVYHAYRLRLPQREKVDAVTVQLEDAFPEAGWRLRSWREAAPRVRYFLDRMSTNLNLIGLCALLVGGLGVSGAVRGYLESKVFHIATMKSLGASGRTIFLTYLVQVLILGALGAGAGLLGGAAIPYLVASLAGAWLPIPLQPGIFPEVLVSAALYGLLIALVFSLPALGVARKVSPAMLFRGYAETDRGSPGRRVWVAVTVGGGLLMLLVFVTSADTRLAAWFVAGALGCFAIFRALASGLLGLARRLPRPANPLLRLALANLHRPGSPAASAIFSLGLGLTALVIISLVQTNLDDRVSESIPAEAPAFFFLDLQPYQVAAFDQLLEATPGVQRFAHFPTLRGRITHIDTVPVEEASIDQDVEWAVRGDRFLSYSADMPQGTELVAGSWWPHDYDGPPRLSLTDDLARGFGVGVGDTLTVNILGREVQAEITSLRKVDWSTLQLNFALLFSPGTLEAAPQTFLATAHVESGSEEGLFRAVTGAFSNVSAIGTREVLENVSRTLARIGAAFKGMAAVALLSGFLVLAGAVSADQHRRIRDAVMFKVCGATRRDIVTTFAAEFILVGGFAGLISAVVGSLAAYGILEGLMKSPFRPHTEVVGATLLVGIALTLVLGLAGTWKALGQKPSAYLRDD